MLVRVLKITLKQENYSIQFNARTFQFDISSKYKHFNKIEFYYTLVITYVLYSAL